MPLKPYYHGMALPLPIMLGGSQVECHSKLTYNFTQHNGQGLHYIILQVYFIVYKYICLSTWELGSNQANTFLNYHGKMA